MHFSVKSELFDAIDIEGVEVSGVIRSPGQYLFQANLLNGQPKRCCEASDGNLIEWGYPERRFRDLKMNGRFVEIVTHPQEYRCKSCKKTFREEIPGLHDRHRMTNRLVEHIIHEAGRCTFSEIAREVGISVSNARKVFVTNMVEHMEDYEFDMPRVLGIDGKYIKGNYIVVIGDIEKRVFLDMIGSNDVLVMKEYFKRRSNHDRVEVITADMEWSFRAIAEEFFPKAMVVVDKYHVLKMANEAMDRLRIDLGKGQNEETRLWYKANREVLLTHKRTVDADPQASAALERMFDEQPKLKVAYEIKEGMFNIYNAKDRHDAEQRYIDWRKAMPLSMKKRFSGLPTAMKTKAKSIFNYFDHRYTNAYIESLNRQVGDLHRDGRGYDFSTLRAKCLVAYGVDRKPTNKFIRVAGRYMTDYELRDLWEGFAETSGHSSQRRAMRELELLRYRKPWLFVRRKRDREM